MPREAVAAYGQWFDAGLGFGGTVRLAGCGAAGPSGPQSGLSWVREREGESLGRPGVRPKLRFLFILFFSFSILVSPFYFLNCFYTNS